MAVVVEKSALEGRGVGVDVEQRGRVREALYSKLFTATEIDRLAALDRDERSLLASQMFSAKEAFYKAQYPITEAWVSFTDVSMEPTADGLLAHPATDLEALESVTWPIDCHAEVRTEHVVTAVVAEPAGAVGTNEAG